MTTIPDSSDYILVAEDDERLCRILAEKLGQQGYRVHCVADGQATLDAAEQERFDLLLLDLNLPKVPGIKVLKALREKFPLTELPIIILTGNLDDEIISKAFDLGANAYFMKPIQWRIFLSSVSTQLEMRRLAERLAQEREFRENVIQSAYEMIITVDPERRITTFNRAAEQKFDYERNEAIGKHINIVYADPQQGEQVYRQIQEQGQFTGEVRNINKRGEVFYSYLYATTLKNPRGEAIGVIGISLDVTREKQLEEQRRNLANLKNEFVEIARHDIKSPLAGIKGYAEMLASMAPAGAVMSEELHSAILRIRKLADVMQNLILDFLDFEALEDGRIRLHPQQCDLRQLLREIIEENEEYAAHKQTLIDVEADGEPMVCAVDPARIKQVLRNLVNNAIKFGGRENEVRLKLIRQPERVCVEVIDNGPGLLPADLDKVFVKYAHLSNWPTEGEKSSGLGLAICKQLVELHGGEIGARNNDGPGATFWFSLPLSSPGARDAPAG